VIRRIREVTDKPIKYVVLTHYHAVRVLGASAYQPQQILASQDTYDLIVERGEQDKASEIGRFPRLFRNVETVPAGMTWPTITFSGKLTLWLGKLEVQLLQLGRGHTKGDTVVWLPKERTLLSGDLVEFDATPYAGDAYFNDWPKTLENVAALKPLALVPGRGPALIGEQRVQAGLASTAGFIADVRSAVQAGVAAGKDLNAVYRDTYAALKPKYGQWVIFDHCMPFDVTRCFDELTKFPDPRIWTAERDVEMWRTLEG
jgi:glyoxylase-like metal-dependent hydrolase (beta-lactamase superfamily II)